MPDAWQMHLARSPTAMSDPSAVGRKTPKIVRIRPTETFAAKIPGSGDREAPFSLHFRIRFQRKKEGKKEKRGKSAPECPEPPASKRLCSRGVTRSRVTVRSAPQRACSGPASIGYGLNESFFFYSPRLLTSYRSPVRREIKKQKDLADERLPC